MSFENSIKIGPEFFAKAKNDYADFAWALTREFFQNSMDAPGSSRIDVEVITVEGGVTQMTVRNNGAPMTREILTEKLLSLGGSGKGFQGTVGGFGKAKEVLYFCHEWYKILTGKLVVEGSGAGYNLTEGSEEVSGTSSTIRMTGDYTEKLVKAVKRFAAFSQWDGTITLNGTELSCKLRKGSPRREFEWGTVYTNKTFKNVVIVRVNGIPMFANWTEFDRTVIIELKGASVDTLTSNRDSLVWRFRGEFDRFLNDLITNKSRALKAQNPTYTHYDGAKYKASKESPERNAAKVNARSIVGDIGGTLPAVAAFAAGTGSTGGAGGTLSGTVLVEQGRIGVLAGEEAREFGETLGEVLEQGEVAPASVISEEFVLKNETTLKIPDYYQPDSDQFGTYSKKLARVWGRLVLELHRMLGLETEFAIGFVFSDDCEAQHEKTDKFGTVYYLNPALIVEQKSSQSKSFKKRFALTERDRLLSIAVHEVVHGLGYESHNEEYAGKLTGVFARVLKERKRFNWCYN